MTTEKTEYKHGVSCSSELKRNLGRPDGSFGSESIGMSATVTVRFDDPEEVMKLLGNPKLVDVIEKVRHLTVTNVSRNVHLEYLEQPEFETPKLVDPKEDIDKAGTSENTNAPMPENDENIESWTVSCEECGVDYQRKWKPVDKEFRKKPYLCNNCYKKKNPKN